MYLLNISYIILKFFKIRVANFQVPLYAGRMEGITHAFLIITLCGDEWSASHSGRFIPGERGPIPGTGVDAVPMKEIPPLLGIEP
jgi:hypothetical protein